MRGGWVYEDWGGRGGSPKLAASVHLQSEQGIQHWIEVDGTGELFSCRSGFEIDPFHLLAFALTNTYEPGITIIVGEKRGNL